MADSYWGKYKTIHIAIVVAMFGHLIIIVSALPPVIRHPSGAMGCFSVGLIFFGIGVGFFKANISPMIAEQAEAQQPRAIVKTLKSGERVVVDPAITISVIYMRYYFFINVGSLVGQISMGRLLLGSRVPASDVPKGAKGVSSSLPPGKAQTCSCLTRFVMSNC